jgi:hypothetical protein
MTALMGEPPSYRWTRLVLFFGFGLFGCYYAIINDSSPTLAFGLGTLMLGIALFSRPLGHFSDFLGRSTRKLPQIADTP